MDDPKSVWGTLSRFVILLKSFSILFLVLFTSTSYAITNESTVSAVSHSFSTTLPSSVLFVDANVADLQTLLLDVSADTKVVVLHRDADGIHQIANVLKKYSDLDSIQLVSHGAPGKLMLGSAILSNRTLSYYQSEIKAWGSALKDSGSILLYGCNVAQGVDGERFIDRVGQRAGTAIAASVDATGAASQGGNWQLEKRLGNVGVVGTLSAKAKSSYRGLLALPSNGIQDVTDAMANGTPTLASFLSGFSFTNNSGYNITGDPTPGANGFYFSNTTAGASSTFTVDADGTNLGSFDLTALSFTNFSIDRNYNFTITGYKLAGGTVNTTFTATGQTFTSGTYTSFTGITGFQVTYVSSNSGPPENITFDSFTIANATAPVTTPSVTGISPSSGPTAGGTSVTITGTGFTGTTGVTVGGAAATGITVVNDTTITATTPAGTVGAKDVVVTNSAGSGTGSGLYTYVAAPTVTGISPSSGPAAGSTSVTITGTNLTGATSVTIGGASATGVTVVNSTTITATTPAGTAGARDVAVTTPGGTGTGAGLFTYIAAPTVTGISPSSGPISGGTSVTITGTNLTDASSVTIGGASATGVTVVNSTTITATTPAGTVGARDVAVTTPGGTGTGAGLFTYVAAPTVTGISPGSGPSTGGTSVTITGTNLTDASSVTIGGASATGVTVVNSTTITATTPAGTAGARDVAVTTPGGTGTGAGLFTYVAAPTVTGVSPSYGTTLGGTSVTITGTNLTGATSVTIGGASATGVTVVNSTTITATTPAGTAGAKDVAVTTTGGTGTGSSLFTYIAAPTVTGISPSSGPTAGGTSVAIIGTSFTGATSVTIGGVAATGVTVVNNTTITATTPAGTVGAKDVVVTNAVGSGTGIGLFTYVAAPTVTGISPGSGPSTGGTSVTITGTNLTGATSVTIGGASATGVTIVNSTTITATTPAGTAGARDVAVTTAGGTGTGAGLFTYIAAPAVTGISPSAGPAAGGTSVTITGTNLTGATSVTIGGVSATGVTVVNSTTITATTPAGTVGAKDVVVTTSGGSGTGIGLFTYYAAPTVTGINPSSGSTAGGTNVTITGTNLSGATSVTIGGAAAISVAVVNSTTITATTPAGAVGAKDVAVTTPGGTGTGVGLFTYVVAPTVTGISPNYGTIAGGTSVTITGTNLTGVTSVTIGGASATGVTVVNATTITATTPAGSAGAKDVVVTTAGGSGTGAGLFIYVTTPTVTGVSPSSGPMTGGTSVTITGTSFTGATSVTVGGAAATGVTVVNDTTITATTPAGTAGTQDIVVTNIVGPGTGTNLFTYTTAVAPDAPTDVTATAYDGMATVNFTAPVSDGGSPITSYTATSAPGGLTGSCTGSAACEITVTGLTNGTAYTFTVTATNDFGTSAASAVSDVVTPRPDPTQDPDVIGVVNDQVEIAGRFWRAQLSNYHQRLESLHHAPRVRSSSAATTVEGNKPALATDNESFIGVGIAKAKVDRVRAQETSTSRTPSSQTTEAEQLTIATVTQLAAILSTESFNLNLSVLNADDKSSMKNDELDIWVAGNVRIGKKDTQDGSTTIDYTSDGITVGADRRYSENLLLGLGIGYAHDESTIGSDGSNSNSNGSSISVYASYQPGDAMFVDGLIGYGMFNLDSSRYVSSSSLFAKANRPGSQIFGSLAVGYEYLDDTTLMSPYVRYDVATDWMESVTETGAGSASLNYASQSYTSQQASLGLRVDLQYKTDAYMMRPRARIEYQHRIDGGDQASIAYADMLATRYTMAVPTLNSNSLLIGLGSSFALRDGLNLDLDYQWVHSTENDESQAIFIRLSKTLAGN